MRLKFFMISAGAVVLVGLAGVGAAQQSAKPAAMTPAKAKALMHLRHERMETIRDNFRLAGREISSGSPDMAKIVKPAATINTLARQSSGWFPAGTGPDVGKTMAKPAIWQNPKDYAAKMTAFQRSAAAFNAAARARNAGAAKAAFGDLGKTCKACHDLYREEH